jgi:hypothetical protein
MAEYKDSGGSSKPSTSKVTASSQKQAKSKEFVEDSDESSSATESHKNKRGKKSVSYKNDEEDSDEISEDS